MKLASILNPDFIKIIDKVESKDKLIEILVDEIYKGYKFHVSKESILKAVMDREALGGTFFDNGLAIPHARIENFNDLVIGVGILKNPINYNNINIKFMVLSIISKSASNTYLKTLSAFAQISQNKELFEKVLNSKNSHEFLNTISEIKIKQEITVADIMSTDIKKVTPDTNLKELCDIFYKYNISYVPVVDENDNFIGEVTVNELLRVGIPNYALMIGNLKFLSSFEPFEELLKNEDKKFVKEIMKKPSIKLLPSSSIIEVALEMTQNNKRHLPVVEGNKIIGIVSFMDLVKKVLRG
ncbi:MAG TPA: PTS sugar transporter subunit IIA [Spirochaetota bacterium]|nr:PTS sugar transporter subunit IIA [Spirochaetota bacterium]HPP04370.1 PTS sugar transporter subunit IIA [Spirochaetota bacterium]